MPFEGCWKTFPDAEVLVHGTPIVRFDITRHQDRSLWRYEGMARGNTAVAVTDPRQPGTIQHFHPSHFGITAIVRKQSA